MKIKTAHCLFEQSGTFKKAFLENNINAIDYDIANDFGETDNVKDLFMEIEHAFDGKPSIFDQITKDDLIVAFFPCTRFEAKIPLSFRGELSQQKNWKDTQKLEYSMKLHEQLHRLYMLISKLFMISLRGGYRMIVENPYTQPHYLTTYFPVKPSLIDKNRTINGDYYKKPTQYWFVNCEPENNFIFEPLEYVPTLNLERLYKNDYEQYHDQPRQIMRSMMHPQYAKRFLRQYILDNERG